MNLRSRTLLHRSLWRRGRRAPSHRREIEREFWREIAKGVTAEEAAMLASVKSRSRIDSTVARTMRAVDIQLRRPITRESATPARIAGQWSGGIARCELMTRL